MRWIAALLVAMLGTLLGLAYGWMLNPAGDANTTLASLRIDYQTDYVLMVAESFRSTQNVEFATRQLALLGSQPPVEIASAAARQARLAKYAPDDLATLDDLVHAMQSFDATGPSGSVPP